MTKQEIKTQVDALLQLPITDDIKEKVSNGVTNIIYTAVEDSYNKMKEYVDFKIGEVGNLTSKVEALEKRVTAIESAIDV